MNVTNMMDYEAMRIYRTVQENMRARERREVYAYLNILDREIDGIPKLSNNQDVENLKARLRYIIQGFMKTL